MKFEEAIAEMRKGKRCRWNAQYEYWISGGRILMVRDVDGSYTNHICMDHCGLFDKDWSVIEPLPPLPRLFRARVKGSGKPVAGAEFPCDNCCVFRTTEGIWYSEKGLTDLEYIDANSR